MILSRRRSFSSLHRHRKLSLLSTLLVSRKHFALSSASFSSSSSAQFPTGQMANPHQVSLRGLKAERPHIEDVMDKYASIPGLVLLALGSTYWVPPKDAVEKLKDDIGSVEVSKYGSIFGLEELRDTIKNHLSDRCGIDMKHNKQDVVISAGANQGFQSVALALCDDGDNAVVLAPYYFSHQLALQLSGAKVSICPFDKATIGVDWTALRNMLQELKPRMVVVTNPNNPSGYVWSAEELHKLVALCRETSLKKEDYPWIVVDQTYHEFLYDGEKHTYPCSKALNYEKIIHMFSFSKSYGMPGWRVGYFVYPSSVPGATDSLRKIQDTIPTHASILSQKLALRCMQMYSSPHTEEHEWVSRQVATLCTVREALWPILEKMGTVRTNGAFYFLVPVPDKVGEEEAVDILARGFGVLLMPGSVFGAPGHLRLSYGSLAPQSVLEGGAREKLQTGLEHLLALSRSRQQKIDK